MLQNTVKVIQSSTIIFFEVPFVSLAIKLNVQGQAEQNNEKKNLISFKVFFFLLMSERTSTYFLEILQFGIAIVFGSDLTSKLVTLNSKTLVMDVWLVK